MNLKKTLARAKKAAKKAKHGAESTESYVVWFYGHDVGIGIRPPYKYAPECTKDSSRACLQVLFYVDGLWKPYPYTLLPTRWLDEQVLMLEIARTWLRKYAIPSKRGYRFKPKHLKNWARPLSPGRLPK